MSLHHLDRAAGDRLRACRITEILEEDPQPVEEYPGKVESQALEQERVDQARTSWGRQGHNGFLVEIRLRDRRLRVLGDSFEGTIEDVVS